MSMVPQFHAQSNAERVAGAGAILAALAEAHVDLRSSIDEVQATIDEISSEVNDLRDALRESAACCAQLRDLGEMALALAASEGSRSAGRALASFKAGRMAATREARP